MFRGHKSYWVENILGSWLGKFSLFKMRKIHGKPESVPAIGTLISSCCLVIIKTVLSSLIGMYTFSNNKNSYSLEPIIHSAIPPILHNRQPVICCCSQTYQPLRGPFMKRASGHINMDWGFWRRLINYTHGLAWLLSLNFPFKLLNVIVVSQFPVSKLHRFKSLIIRDNFLQNYIRHLKYSYICLIPLHHFCSTSLNMGYKHIHISTQINIIRHKENCF